MPKFTFTLRYGSPITSPHRNLTYNRYGNHNNQAMYPAAQPRQMRGLNSVQKVEFSDSGAFSAGGNLYQLD